MAYFTHIAAWSASEKSFLTQHHEKEVQPDSCICRTDYLEVKRHLSHYNYIPKWKKVRQTDKCKHMYTSRLWDDISWGETDQTTISTPTQTQDSDQNTNKVFFNK